MLARQVNEGFMQLVSGAHPVRSFTSLLFIEHLVNFLRMSVLEHYYFEKFKRSLILIRTEIKCLIIEVTCALE